MGESSIYRGLEIWILSHRILIAVASDVPSFLFSDYTIHPHPQPIHPSYRLVVTLRLLAIPYLKKGKKDVNTWKDMINGIVDTVSNDNEEAMHKILLKACQTMKQKIQSKRDNLSTRLIQLDNDHHDSSNNEQLLLTTTEQRKSNMQMVQKLLDEEVYILCAMERAIQLGHTDW